jgi:carboxypeptidase D
LIGNGWISPAEQYHAYLDMAYKSGIVQGGSDTARELEAFEADCTNELNKPGAIDHVDISLCENILVQFLRLTQKDGRCVNMYDVRLDDTYPDCGMNWPPDLTSVTPYLRRPDVVKALNVNTDKKTGWTECAGAVTGQFKAAKSKPSITMLPGLLEHVPVVLFSGDQDLICNHLGTEQLIHNMEWNGGKGFEISPGTLAPRRDWTFEGEPAGIYQEARNLTYVLFYNSSHMVPFDYPRRSRDMLDRFMNVDIASIGGTPADSRIDGEKGVETSVGGHPNSTAAEQAEKDKLEEARWAAYYKSGEVALIVVIILASAFGWYVWRDRRRRAGYHGLFGGSDSQLLPSGMGLGGHSRSGRNGRDVEAADFDESELDDLHVVEPREEGEGAAEERYSLGGDSDEEDEKVNGHANRRVR